MTLCKEKNKTNVKMNNLNHEERFAQEVVERGGGVEQQHVEAQPIPS